MPVVSLSVIPGRRDITGLDGGPDEWADESGNALRVGP